MDTLKYKASMPSPTHKLTASTFTELRVLSFNMHKGVGWLTPRSTLRRIREEIRTLQPDVILLQETHGSQFMFLAEHVCPHFSYGKNAVYTKGHHGNAILSRFPIIFSQNIDISMNRFDRRGLLHSIVTLPHGQTLHLLCVHLGLLKRFRHRQLEKIVAYVNETIPADEPLILGGDFNDWRSHATVPLIETLGLQEAFLNHHGAYAKTFPAWAPLLRLDRLYCRGFNTHHAKRLVHRSWKFLSDHLALHVSLKP